MQFKKTAAKITAVIVMFLVAGLAPTAADEILGIDGDGVISIIDTVACSVTLLKDTDIDTGTYGPNSLAYDQTNRRVYFATLPDNCPEVAGDPAELYFYDVGADTTTLAGTLIGCPADADFHSGAYYYIGNGTDDLYEVTFMPNGLKASEGQISDLTGGDDILTFGDITVRNDGIVFGHAMSSFNGLFNVFTFDLAGPAGSFSYINDVPALRQVTFGVDGSARSLGTPSPRTTWLQSIRQQDSPAATCASALS